VDPLDASAIAEAIGRVLTDKSLVERLVAGGHERVKSFTWEKSAADTVASYERAIAAHNGAGVSSRHKGQT
jgi:glycosyltransferase involved in cell wall biosynthesis